ncbi:MAG: IS1595 family transposase, partial [Proteobacteria bacterium]|nr:IS1595 family transposase [Pseudomonadota bacterium]
MNIVSIYKIFPTYNDCLAHLENIRWGDKPICPYCKSTNSTPLKKEHRHHCNNCNTSYSITVRTIFHRTHLDLQKWFLAISLILNAKKGISARQLARDLEINKDTAWYMAMRIRRAMREDFNLLQGIIEIDDTYVGGKGKKGSKRGRGTSKTPVVGMVERKGRIKAGTVKNIDSKTVSSLVRGKIDTKNTVIMTDEFKGYLCLSKYATHKTINHQKW